MVKITACINLINGTPYSWIQSPNQPQPYQMINWTFPTVIVPGQSHQQWFTYDDGRGMNAQDDQGRIRYLLNGTTGHFSSQYDFELRAFKEHNDGKQRLTVNMTSIPISTQNRKWQGVLDLSFMQNKCTPFMLSGFDGYFSTNNPPLDWMHASLPVIGKQTLRQIAIPGSHNSGSSRHNGGIPKGNQESMACQNLDLGMQLYVGVRYFDIKPVRTSNGEWYTGNYRNGSQGVSRPTGWNGQSLKEIVRQVNDFTENNKELVILNLSHSLDLTHFTEFDDEQWQQCLSIFSNLTHLFYAPNNVTDLSMLTLNELIGTSAAVILISQQTPTLGQYASKGFYPASALSIFEHPTEKADPYAMINDQVSKLQTFQRSKDGTDKMFLLSWTCTQQRLGGGKKKVPTLKALVEKINPLLYEDLLPACNKTNFPNILSMDFVGDTKPAALAAVINSLVRFVW